MYQFIPAEEKHLDQIAALLTTTGYWDFTLKDNTLGLSPYYFMRELIAKSHLPYTTVVTNNNDDSIILGVIVCASTKEISELPDHTSYRNPKIIDLFYNYWNSEITDSYHINFLAVSNTYRKQGLGKKLLDFAEKRSVQKGFETLSLWCISCQTSAIKLYLNAGMMITKTMSISDLLPFPSALYFEKNSKLMRLHDYFDTEEYKVSF